MASENLLSPESTREQRQCGLHLLTSDQVRRLRSHNAEYRDRFGFTFIICARENKAAAILAGLDRRSILLAEIIAVDWYLVFRLTNSREKEIEIGIGEVKKIAKLRAIDILTKCVSPQSKL